jgi:hypothetical protein
MLPQPRTAIVSACALRQLANKRTCSRAQTHAPTQVKTLDERAAIYNARYERLKTSLKKVLIVASCRARPHAHAQAHTHSFPVLSCPVAWCRHAFNLVLQSTAHERNTHTHTHLGDVHASF